MDEVTSIKEDGSDNLSAEDKYKKEQKERLSVYVVGEKDNMGYTINKIFARGDEYIIYEVREASDIESLKVVIDTAIEDNDEPVNNFHSVKDKFDRLKSVLYKSGADASYKQRAASALATAIRGGVEDSKKLFESIESDAEDDYRHQIYGRLVYLLGAILVVVILSLSSLTIYLNRSSPFFLENHAIVFLAYAATYAALGGFFSVSMKAKEVFAQRAIAYWMYLIYGAERIAISLVAGIAAYTFVESGLVFPRIDSSELGGMYAMLSLCFLAGFSETLIPSALNKLESSVEK